MKSEGYLNSSAVAWGSWYRGAMARLFPTVTQEHEHQHHSHQHHSHQHHSGYKKRFLL